MNKTKRCLVSGMVILTLTLSGLSSAAKNSGTLSGSGSRKILDIPPPLLPPNLDLSGKDSASRPQGVVSKAIGLEWIFNSVVQKAYAATGDQAWEKYTETLLDWIEYSGMGAQAERLVQLISNEPKDHHGILDAYIALLGDLHPQNPLIQSVADYKNHLGTPDGIRKYGDLARHYAGHLKGNSFQSTRDHLESLSRECRAKNPNADRVFDHYVNFANTYSSILVPPKASAKPLEVVGSLVADTESLNKILNPSKQREPCLPSGKENIPPIASQGSNPGNNLSDVIEDGTIIDETLVQTYAEALKNGGSDHAMVHYAGLRTWNIVAGQGIKSCEFSNLLLEGVDYPVPNPPLDCNQNPPPKGLREIPKNYKNRLKSLAGKICKAFIKSDDPILVQELPRSDWQIGRSNPPEYARQFLSDQLSLCTPPLRLETHVDATQGLISRHDRGFQFKNSNDNSVETRAKNQLQKSGLTLDSKDEVVLKEVLGKIQAFEAKKAVPPTILVSVHIPWADSKDDKRNRILREALRQTAEALHQAHPKARISLAGDFNQDASQFRELGPDFVIHTAKGKLGTANKNNRKRNDSGPDQIERNNDEKIDLMIEYKPRPQAKEKPLVEVNPPASGEQLRSKLDSSEPLTSSPVSTAISGKWRSIASSGLQESTLPRKNGKWVMRKNLSSTSTPPPVIGHSSFVSPEMVEHLMRKKKDSAIGVKFEPGDEITNMEGLLHTYVTPVLSVKMVGDYKYDGGHAIQSLNGKERKVIMSAAIQPDFENDEVMMKLAELGSDELAGRSSPPNLISAEQKKDPKLLGSYESHLLQYVLHNLTQEKKRPSLERAQEIKNLGDLESLIEGDFQPNELKNKFFKAGGKNLSAEILLNSYLEQLRNELGVLEKACPQGYVYTIDPPSIFVRAIGSEAEGGKWLNRLQALAFKVLASEGKLKNMKAIGFNNYSDSEMVDLLKAATSNRKGSENEAIRPEVRSKSDFFPKPGNYSYPACPDCALVVHNNSDAFGQNIETEGTTSMDGILGNASDASAGLRRNRKDLLDHLFRP